MRGRAVVARRAHNPEVLGSNPSPATKEKTAFGGLFAWFESTHTGGFALLLGSFAHPRCFLSCHCKKVPKGRRSNLRMSHKAHNPNKIQFHLKVLSICKADDCLFQAFRLQLSNQIAF